MSSIKVGDVDVNTYEAKVLNPDTSAGKMLYLTDVSSLKGLTLIPAAEPIHAIEVTLNGEPVTGPLEELDFSFRDEVVIKVTAEDEASIAYYKFTLADFVKYEITNESTSEITFTFSKAPAGVKVNDLFEGDHYWDPEATPLQATVASMDEQSFALKIVSAPEEDYYYSFRIPLIFDGKKRPLFVDYSFDGKVGHWWVYDGENSGYKKAAPGELTGPALKALENVSELEDLKGKDTVSLSFTPAVGAEEIWIEQAAADGIWMKSTTEPAELEATANSATIISLTPNTEYRFKVMEKKGKKLSPQMKLKRLLYLNKE